jgi:hypothetical protein
MTEALVWDILRWVVFIALEIFLCVLIFRLLTAVFWAMGRGGIWLETNWGGLGGGLSGWRISDALVYLLLIALLLGCLMLAVVTLPPHPKINDNKGAAKDATQAEKSGGSKGGEQNAGKPTPTATPTATPTQSPEH